MRETLNWYYAKHGGRATNPVDTGTECGNEVVLPLPAPAYSCVTGTLQWGCRDISETEGMGKR